MHAHLLLLLVLLWDPISDAAILNDNVLARIVSRFKAVAASRGTSGSGAERQFAFLMALSADECANPQFDNYVPAGTNGNPIISGNTAQFQTEQLANYMAVYPSGGSRCSENKLLYENPQYKQPPTNTNAAQRFQNLLNNRPPGNQLQVGCVILYTTYTPCIQRCFSDNENCEIIGPIRQQPFSTSWANSNVQKYFVFSDVYNFDNNANRIPIIRNKLGQVSNAGFEIRKCEGNQIQCTNCNSNNNYCIPSTT
uniref:uncharacterized protein n=1 Tax=Pristiophorus japonicus TaxID=55135 RepID=UPI00398F7624